MRVNTLLANTGYKFDRKTKKYFDPVTERKVSLQTAKDRASKVYGYKNYTEAKAAFSSKAYARIVERFAKEAGIPNDYQLQKLFSNAWKARTKSKSKELADLLKYVGKINKYRAVYAGAL